MNCPLCFDLISDDHQVIDGHLLLRCPNCFLLFKDPQNWPALTEEKLIYDHHQNDPHDSRYQQYLLKNLSPILDRISQGAIGLDYGCGPSKGVETICQARGIKCLSYDPLYFPNEEIFNLQFDFIIINEVAEHFQRPGDEFKKITSLLKTHAYVGLRTEIPPNNLEGWWYIKDPTHIVFYGLKTLLFIAEKYSYKMISQTGPITLFEKK